MTFNKIRHVVLTLDPLRFKPSIDTYRQITKQVAYFIKELKRSEKLPINRYIKVLEFHRSGLPHFHVLIEKESLGMITKEVIQKYWPHGNVWETFFKSERHFKQFAGYFNKNGYLEKSKGHQNQLPEYALKSTEIFRRFIYSFRFDKLSTKEKVDKKDVINPREKTSIKNTNEFRLAQCGKKTKVDLFDHETGSFSDGAIVNIPLKKFLQFFAGECEYRENTGYVVKCNRKIMYAFLKEHDPECDLDIEQRIKDGFLSSFDLSQKWERYSNF